MKPPVRIHNYQLGSYRHSTYFLNEKHARFYWLPYLWGHALEKYTAFYHACLDLSRAQADRRNTPGNFLQELEKFQRLEWNWYLRVSGTQSFNAYVLDSIGAKRMHSLDARYPCLRPTPRQLVLDATAVRVSDSVFRALAEQRKPIRDNPSLLEFLNPAVGIELAAQETFKEIAGKLAGGWRP